MDPMNGYMITFQFDADFNGLRVSDWQIAVEFKFATIFVKVKYARGREGGRL
jgi:hypothetical protein